MTREEQRLLKVVAGVGGLVLGCIFVMPALNLPPLFQFGLLGLAIIGQFTMIFAAARINARRRLGAPARRTERYRFKRYPDNIQPDSTVGHSTHDTNSKVETE
jgi:hypothetical protein